MKYDRLMRYALLIVCVFCCSGCFGTVMSRSNMDAFGRYPGYAVYLDAYYSPIENITAHPLHC
jgi:hypothetical protein